MFLKKVLGAIILALLLAGCQRSLPLTQTLEITDFGYRMDYPEGWSVAKLGNSYLVTEFEEDAQMTGGQPLTRGIGINFQHETLDFLRGLGLAGDPPSLDELFALNIGELSGMTNPVIDETTLFGEPALRSKYYEHQWDILYAGIVGDEAYFLWVTAPTEEMLEDFMPTLDAMLASIRPISE